VGHSGQQTLVLHWNGTAWSRLASPNPGAGNHNLYGVAAASASEAWAVGYYQVGSGYYSTLVESWNGTTWSVVPSTGFGVNSNFLYGIAALANEPWVAGYTVTGTSNGYQTLTERYLDPCITPLPTNTPTRTPTITSTRTHTPTGTNTLTRTPTSTYTP